jgi:flagellar hook-associated protein 3 FlgL
MRISTAQIYNAGVSGIDTQQSALSHTQQQIASGRRIQTPSDDPIAASQALTLSQAKDRITQYGANIDAAKDALGLNDSVLSQVNDVLQSLRTLVVSAGNPSLNDTDRASLATDAAGQLQTLIGIANTKDADGHYLFSGFAGDTQAFTTSGSGAIVYNGDQGNRTLDVAPGRSMQASYNGSDVFQQVRNGNGSFVASASGSNTGGGTIDAGSVVNPSLLPGDTYRLQFNVSGGVTTYDVIDVTTSTTVSSGNAYTGGGTITVAGMQVAVGGAPASGDTFTLAPSTSQSVFTTLQNLITTLKTPAAGTAANAQLQNGLSAALANIDQASDHVLTIRADAGAGLAELDSLASSNSDRSLQYDATMSRLTDLDYNKALSDFARQQLSLQAAQKSFAAISSLSLFNFL